MPWTAPQFLHLTRFLKLNQLQQTTWPAPRHSQRPLHQHRSKSSNKINSSTLRRCQPTFKPRPSRMAKRSRSKRNSKGNSKRSRAKAKSPTRLHQGETLWSQEASGLQSPAAGDHLISAMQSSHQGCHPALHSSPNPLRPRRLEALHRCRQRAHDRSRRLWLVARDRVIGAPRPLLSCQTKTRSTS